MTNAEATITENAATAAEQGVHVAPKEPSSKKGATQKKGAPKGQKAAKGKAKAEYRLAKETASRRSLKTMKSTLTG
jgi:ribosomal protein L19E